MNNAYSVLGVSPNDNEQTIKTAYRTKAFEIENSNLSTEEKQIKMAELDSAFDFVFNEKRGSTNGSSTFNSNSQYPDVRQLLNENRFDDAETILNGIPENMRYAEWHYLKGVVFRNRGWLNEAHSCFKTACAMDENNQEYKNAFDSLTKNANGGYKVKNNDSSSGCCDCCDCCDCTPCCCGDDCCSDLCSLWCCDSICECFGFDLCGCF